MIRRENEPPGPGKIFLPCDSYPKHHCADYPGESPPHVIQDLHYFDVTRLSSKMMRSTCSSIDRLVVSTTCASGARRSGECSRPESSASRRRKSDSCSSSDDA